MKSKDILVISIIFIATFLLLEQTIRLYIFGFDSFSYKQMESIRSMGHSGFIQAADEESIVYELKPNIDSRLKLVSFKTNSNGLRDKEYNISKPPDTFRVAVIGSSFTFGSGVRIEDTYHSILEDRLNNESGDLQYEFLNFGVGGYTSRNKLATIEHKALSYEPDLILFVLDGSQYTDEKFKKFVPKPKKNHFFRSYIYKLISKNKLFKSKEKRELEFTQTQLEHLDTLDNILKTLKKMSQDNRIPVCVVLLDHDYMHMELGDEIIKLISLNNLCYANTIPAFADMNFDDLTIYRVDFHPNATAHKIFADSIYDDLIEQSVFNNDSSSQISIEQ